MSTDGQGTKCRRNLAENFNRLSRVHERYRQTTDGRATAISEREREFTFAENDKQHSTMSVCKCDCTCKLHCWNILERRQHYDPHGWRHIKRHIIIVRWRQLGGACYGTLERCNPWPHVANRHMSISQLLSSCWYYTVSTKKRPLSMFKNLQN